MDRDRLVAVGEASAAKDERQFFAADAGGCALQRRHRLVAQRLDPEPRGIDNVEDDGIGLRDLAVSPSVRAAASSSVSTASNAARRLFVTSGRAWIVAAMIAAVTVNVSRMPSVR